MVIMMAIDSKHPDYIKEQGNIQLCRLLYEGEAAVKELDTLLLPPTSGMVLDGMGAGERGRQAYENYKLRARVPDDFKGAVETYIGMLHTNPIETLELPASLEFLRTKATSSGEGTGMLLRRINAEQLIAGRLILTVNFKTVDGVDVPYVAIYYAENGINWDDEDGELTFLVLDESEMEMNSDYNWVEKKQFRVFELVDGVLTVTVKDASGTDLEDPVNPSYRGKTFNKIPAVMINAMDIANCMDKPPLLGLADLLISMYRSDADYRQNLFMQSQDTLVTIGSVLDPHNITGAQKPLRIGAGSRISMDIGGDAKFIGVSSTGLQEQREALANDRAMVQQKSGQLANAKANGAESGKALTTRIGAQTANLNQMALAGAAGVLKIYQMIAEWVGLGKDQIETIIVIPNTEFAEKGMTAQELLGFVQAKALGAPISDETLHDIMEANNLTSLSYEDELLKINEEKVN